MRKNFIIAKQLLSILLAFVLLLGATGCMFKESKEEQAIEYMNNKYDDTFTFDGYAGGDSSFLLLMKCNKFPDETIYVTPNKDENGNYVFSDNYLFLKYKKEATEEIQNMLEYVFNCDVKLTLSGGDGNLSGETSFEDFISSYQSGIFVSAIVSNDYGEINKNTIESRLKDGFKNHHMIFSAIISFAETEEQFEKRGTLPNSAYADIPYITFTMKETGKFEFLAWRNK